MERIIIEVGSTNTKIDKYDGKTIQNLGTETIEFKKNYKNENKLNENDVEKLINVVNKSKEINDKYNPVKFNAEGNEEISFNKKLYKNEAYNESRKNSRNSMHAFTGFLKIQGYPSMVVINNKAQIEKTIVGYRTADQLKAEL